LRHVRAVAQIAADGCRVSRACMGSGQCVPTHLAIAGETYWLHRVDLNRSLHVTELSYVVVVATKAGRTKEYIARCLHQALSHDHSLTVIGIHIRHQRPCEPCRSRHTARAVGDGHA
jgi:hypothetical protein